jgi:hypothetical protein
MADRYLDVNRLKEAYQSVVRAVKTLPISEENKLVAKAAMALAENVLRGGAGQAFRSLQHMGDLGEDQIELGRSIVELMQLAIGIHDGTLLNVVVPLNLAVCEARKEIPHAYARLGLSYNAAVNYAAIIVNDLRHQTEFVEAKLTEEQEEHVTATLAELITARLQVSLDEYEEVEEVEEEEAVKT